VKNVANYEETEPDWDEEDPHRQYPRRASPKNDGLPNYDRWEGPYRVDGDARARAEGEVPHHTANNAGQPGGYKRPGSKPRHNSTTDLEAPPSYMSQEPYKPHREEYKAMPDQEDTLKGQEETLEEEAPTDEPYGAQVLRRLYEDGCLLVEKYTPHASMVEHPQVKRHALKRLQMAQALTASTGALFKKFYGHLAPLEGEMGVGGQGQKAMNPKQPVPAARQRFVPDDPAEGNPNDASSYEGRGVMVSEDADVPPVGGTGFIRSRARGIQYEPYQDRRQVSVREELPRTTYGPGGRAQTNIVAATAPYEVARDAAADRARAAGGGVAHLGSYQTSNERANRRGGVRTRPIKTEGLQPPHAQPDPKPEEDLRSRKSMEEEAKDLARMAKDLQKITSEM
jgi:hypothetical protein